MRKNDARGARVPRELHLTIKDEVDSRGHALRCPNTTLDNLREVVSTLEERERTARRVLGGANRSWWGLRKSAKRTSDGPRPGR